MAAELGRTEKDEIGWQSHHRFSFVCREKKKRKKKSQKIQLRNERGKGKKEGDLEEERSGRRGRSNWKSCQDWGVEKRFVCTAGLRRREGGKEERGKEK